MIGESEELVRMISVEEKAIFFFFLCEKRFRRESKSIDDKYIGGGLDASITNMASLACT